MTEYDYDLDVAISFANEDLGLAMEIREKLGSALNVFVYAAKQEELAGTDGLQSFRDVFRHRARLVVILHRSKWGKTPWTRVEEEAITDRFLKEGPGFLFVVMMDASPPPPWLPDKLIRFSLQDFGVEQAVGAIKARALERGSVLHRASAADLARRVQEATEFSTRRMQLMRTEEGVKLAAAEAQRLVALLAQRAQEAQEAAPALGIEYGTEPDVCVIRTKGVGLDLFYRNDFVNVLDEARVTIRECRGGLILPGENLRYIREPKELVRLVYKLDFTRALGWCWAEDGSEPQTSEQVAESALGRFLALIRKDAAGEFPPLW